MFLIVSHSKPYKQIELNLFQHYLVFINKSIAKAVYVMESDRRFPSRIALICTLFHHKVQRFESSLNVNPPFLSVAAYINI